MPAPQIFEVELPLRGRLFVMPKPSAEFLAEDMAYFRSVGVGHIVSLMECDEMAELSLTREGDAARREGMTFENFPIKDYSVPDRKRFDAFATRMRVALAEGHSIAVHCRAGIGRTGMLSSAICLPFFEDADAAMDHVSSSRGVNVPDTDEQADFVRCLADKRY